MDIINLNVLDRLAHKGKFKEDGFVPGVLYGDGFAQTINIKVREAELKKIIAHHGENARVTVVHGEAKKEGLLREVQRNPVTWAIRHVDIQSISKSHVMRLHLPISFHGKERLTDRSLQLQIHKPNIEVSGKMDIIPESIEIDVSSMHLKDQITAADFKLDKNVIIHDKPDEIYATVAYGRVKSDEPEKAAVEVQKEKSEPSKSE